MKERDDAGRHSEMIVSGKTSADPNYQHNVAKADIILMHAAEYSDL